MSCLIDSLLNLTFQLENHIAVLLRLFILVIY